MENTACSVANPRRWYLIDLECCVKAGTLAPPLLNTSHVVDVLVEGCFTAASDLALLGNLLISRGLRNFVTSEAGRAFLSAICVPAPQQHKSAQQLLADAWLCCGGDACRDAGAIPGEE